MKTNIITPITLEMRQSLPEGYAIYGNGNDDFAKLVKKAGRPEIILWLGSWCIPAELVGANGRCIYAVPIGSVLYSLLCEVGTQAESDTEPPTREDDYMDAITLLEHEYNTLIRQSDECQAESVECRTRAMKIKAGIDALKNINQNK